MITPSKFYTKLTPTGLKIRKTSETTEKEIKYLKRLLKKKDKILDLGCGYGRFTIPLAKMKYDIEGIDITPDLIEEAKKDSIKNKVKIKFRLGDMRNLPYNKESFTVILCMWSVFMELPKEKDQIKAIKEMLRVLSKKGWALIELPQPFDKFNKSTIKRYEKDDDTFKFDKNTRIVRGKLSGIEFMPSYNHNEETLNKLMKKANITDYKIFYDSFGGRERLFLRIIK